MNITWSEIQYKRLIELDAPIDKINSEFIHTAERDSQFQILEKQLIKKSRHLLNHFREEIRIPALCRLQNKLVETLTRNDFVQVTTPTLMSRHLLKKMTIDESHPLFSQVFWVSKDKCLRPMLAPHLYYILKDLLRLWEKPVRIFEVGSCFRKESQGSKHSQEFTMLNLVEMGLPETERRERLKELASWVMKAAGIDHYSLENEDSSVYGETTDIVVGEEKIEVGSGAMGPHPLDIPWRITDTWVGIGFGLERLLMIKENSSNLAKIGRSLTYLNGTRLNI
jgi:phenylalanyl-tRNA synthetase alpha chain